MPSTLPASMGAVVLLAVLAGAGTLVIRRYGVKTADPLDPAWHWLMDRARDIAAVASPGSLTASGRRLWTATSESWDGVLDRARSLAEGVRAGGRGMIPAPASVAALAPPWRGVMLASDSGSRRRGLFRRRRDALEEAPAGDEEAGDRLEEAGDKLEEEPAAGDAAVAQVMPAEPEPELPDEPVRPEPVRPAPARRQRPRPKLNYIPLEQPERAEPALADEETFKTRLRRGLRKTRDYLNRDVREVFGSGPIPEAFDSLEEILVRADVGVATAMTLSEELRQRRGELTSDTLPRALRDSMRAQLEDADRRLRVNEDGLSVWLVVGVNGSGKTTACAKLAAHATSQGFSVCLAAADTFRAAAIEQLETWAGRIGVDIVRQHAGADPAAVVFDAIEHAKARGHDLVIADTAGRLHTRTPLMEELRKVRRVVERQPGLLTETLLVLDATTGQNGIVQAKAFADAVDVTGLVLAKLDGTAKGGIVIAVERDLAIPVKAVGVGEQAEDLAPFDPDSFVDALFGEG